MAKVESVLDEVIERTGGILPLKPTFVRRFYMDGGRLGLGKKPGDTFQPDSRLWIPERWIASTVEAVNPHPIKGEGLSRIATRRAELTLRDAIKLRGDLLLGEGRNRAHGDFLVLVKILDPYEPIVFHFHASDEAIASAPLYFVGHRFGKDEAYYFLEAPKGNVPYTHVGLHKGVGIDELKRALEKGRDYILELSPHFYQRYGEGFFVPAGVPHRPGTALTLEVQQPSDVYTLLEVVSGGRRMSAEQIHPGFPDLDTALQFINFELAQQDDLLERYRLLPMPVDGGRQAGGEEDWIVPPSLTKKFSAKRLIVRSKFESVEGSPYALLVWRGKGKLNGRAIRPGNEFFVSHIAATKPHIFESDGEPLVVFKFFPADLSIRPANAAL